MEMTSVLTLTGKPPYYENIYFGGQPDESGVNMCPANVASPSLGQCWTNVVLLRDSQGKPQSSLT